MLFRVVVADFASILGRAAGRLPTPAGSGYRVHDHEDSPSLPRRKVEIVAPFSVIWVPEIAEIRATIIAVTLANRRMDEPARVTIGGLPARASGALTVVAAADLFARNSIERPDAISVRTRVVDADSQGRCTVDLAPAAVGVASFA